MSKKAPPVPAPRRKVLPSDRSEDKELENEPEKSPTRAERGVTPPPVAPKTWTMKKHAVENVYMEMVNVTETVNCRSQPPPLPPQRAPQLQLRAWTDLLGELKGAKEATIIKAQAEHLYKAIQRFNILVSDHGVTLENNTLKLLCIADHLDKVSKGTKIAGITGGATSAVGGGGSNCRRRSGSLHHGGLAAADGRRHLGDGSGGDHRSRRRHHKQGERGPGQEGYQ
ncbi:hypothetical protein CgunFtcFv8_021459 [Champsocephalus gunnari]|uniref:Uncharacterized protein n=1 Tax=Champsocephalus gunnari TaxID=52237 RepID=A0AAN8DPE9_CHAGU|nr:hypothetical protein CgunFtcFv8_021459 [Champsocephalus gunnari]